MEVHITKIDLMIHLINTDTSSTFRIKFDIEIVHVDKWSQTFHQFLAYIYDLYAE